MADCNGVCSDCQKENKCNDKLSNRLALIKNKIMILSGKGGVGKSSIAASLAISLASSGKKVGVLDIDFHGPSIPILFGLQHARIESDGKNIVPLEAFGVKVVSVAFMVNSNVDAIVWRGPMKMEMLKMLLSEVNWGELDYLIMDFPPGTGDEALSACQLVPDATGGIIVTTPQEISLADCRRCISFCDLLKLPILGIVENMSGFVCSKCGEITNLFTSGGGENLAKQANLPFLGKIPMDPKFVTACDTGEIKVFQKSKSPVNDIINDITQEILDFNKK